MEFQIIALKGQNLKRTFHLGNQEVKALDQIDIKIYQGELVMLLGPSGSGKTTLLHTLSGLDTPDSGEVFVDNVSIYGLNDNQLSHLRSRSFGFIFQSFNLLPNLTALENVEIPLRITGQTQAKEKALAMLKRVGLEDRAQHRPGQLSGGEQQRVTVARALVAKPKIVFADEPTGNLDSVTSMEIMNLLQEMVIENNSACLMVTHNSELVPLANRVLHLRDGHLLKNQKAEGAQSC
ncbi:MAG TPA: ABC transporter ATP-binding protein [Bacillota bacterium]|nr:ABC transporter ATP-binding protein [Bacillota bacterium]